MTGSISPIEYKFTQDNTPIITNSGFKDCAFGTLELSGKTYSIVALSRKKSKEHSKFNKAYESEIKNLLFLKENFPNSKHFTELVHIDGSTLFFVRCQFDAAVFLKDDIVHPWEFKKTVAYDVIAAVNFLHTNGLLHRDVKPDNVMIDAEGHGRLCDQQFVCKQDDPLARKILGTFAYLSPDTILSFCHRQRFRSRKLSITENDIWQTGLTVQLILEGYNYDWLEVAMDFSVHKATDGDFYRLHNQIEEYCGKESINFLGLLSFDPDDRSSLTNALQNFATEITFAASYLNPDLSITEDS